MPRCVVVGGGVAGLSAALVLGRARHRTLVLDREGQSNRVAQPVGGLLGQDAQVAAYNAAVLRLSEAVDARLEGEGFVVTLGDDGGEVRARALILATGMDYEVPDVPGFREHWGGGPVPLPFCHGWEVRDPPLVVTNQRARRLRRRRPGPAGRNRNPAPGSNVLTLHSQALAISPGPQGLSEGRGFIDRTLSAAGFDAGTRYQITVAANEAVSNAMEHGAPCDDGHFHLETTVAEGSFVFSVRDCGQFEHAASPAPDPVAERGRGFAFMNLLMDDVLLEARPGNTVLRLAKHLPGTAPAVREADPAAAEQNRRVVRELFDTFAARDVERTIELVDRGVMIEPLSTPVERRTPYLGVDGMRRYLQDLDGTWDEFDVTIGDVRAGGNHVVAAGRVYARQESLVADDPVAFVFKLRDARVVWMKVYRSEADALAAAGWD